MALLSVTVAGADFKLQALPNKIQDASERALDESAAAILSWLRQGFLDQRAPSGNPWIPTEAGRRREATGSGQTLYDTGRLFQSIQLYKTAKDERTIGTDVDYAPDLEYGRPGFQARPFLIPGQKQIESAFEIFVFRMKDIGNE